MEAVASPRKYETRTDGLRKRELSRSAEEKRKVTLESREREAIDLAQKIAGAITRKSKQRKLTPDEERYLQYAYSVPTSIRKKGKIQAWALDGVEKRLDKIESGLLNSDQRYFHKPDEFRRAHE